MNTQRNNVQIEYTVLIKAIKYVVILLIILPLAAYLSFWSYFSLYVFIYDPPFSYRKIEEGSPTPIGLSTMSSDAHRNAEITDQKYNMILVLTLPNHHKGKPVDEHWGGFVSWSSRPKSNTFTEFDSDYGHNVGVRLHKNSFVVVDGMTGKELIVHPITKEERERYSKGLYHFEWLRHDGSPCDNLLEWSFDFFSLPKEKFLEIQEKVNQHDTSNEEDGPGYRFDGKFIPDSR